MKLKQLYVLFLSGLLFMAMTGTAVCGTTDYSRFISINAGGHFFEDNQHLDDQATVGLGLGAEFNNQFGYEGVINFTGTETELGDIDVDVYTYRLDGFYNILTDREVTPYVAAGVGGLYFKSDDTGFKNDDFMVNYGAGLKYIVNKDFTLRADVRHVISFNNSNSDSHSNVLATIGVLVHFDIHKAKVAASSYKGKAVAGTPGPNDADGDGVLDAMDKCPDTPAGVAVDASGCPFDSDGDGVPDYMDECPNTPKGVDVTGKGCWEIRGALFETDMWDIKPGFHHKLDAVVKVLKDDPELVLEIQGHADIRGTDNYNQSLSEKRASAVVKYIKSKGIDPERLKSMGFGFHKPVAPNDTPENMAKNRRVEVKQTKISINF